MSAVQIGDRLVHQALQPLPDLLDPVDRLAAGVQVPHRVLDRVAGQHALASARISCRSDWYSDQPQAYASAGSMLAPVQYRAEVR